MPEAEARKCRIKGCKRPYRAKGYCNVHYGKWRKGEYGHARFKTCTKEGCRKPRFMGSLCKEHHEARLKAGSEKAAAPAAAAKQAESKS